MLVDFNTSYVVVQQLRRSNDRLLCLLFQYILCCGSTLDIFVFKDFGSEFQYILCCGSTSL